MNDEQLIADLIDRGVLRQVPDLWVHTGPDIYVQGVPFGGWQRTGEGFKGSGSCFPDTKPVYEVVHGV